MNERIGIYMRVFRNEPGIHDAVKSVLAQTYSNWKFYVIVNDKTEEVIRSYAEKDDRIEVIMKPEGEFLGTRYYLKRMANDNNAYVCTLDGDDTLSPDFLKEMLEFSVTNKTDISFCGYNVCTSDSTVSSLVLNRDYIWTIEETNEVFTSLYQFFRTSWGALYSSELINKYDIKRCPPAESFGGYGGDTITVFNCLYFCQKCGYRNIPLYNYHLSTTSDSHILEPGRLNSDKVLFDFVKNFLIEKSTFGLREDIVLHLIYGYALVDSVKLVLQVNNTADQLYKDLNLLLSAQLTKEALDYTPNYQSLPGYDDKTGNLTRLLFIALSTSEKFTALPTDKQYDLYALLGFSKEQLLTFEEYQFVSLFPNLLGLYHYGEKELLFSTLLKILAYSVKIHRDTVLPALFKRISTNNIEDILFSSDQCIFAHKDIVISLHNLQFQSALNSVKQLISENTDLPFFDELTQVWILCAATLEIGSDFILAKKIRSEFLAKHSRKDEALVELNDITDMGVNDQETEYLRSLIESI